MALTRLNKFKLCGLYRRMTYEIIALILFASLAASFALRQKGSHDLPHRALHPNFTRIYALAWPIRDTNMARMIGKTVQPRHNIGIIRQRETALTRHMGIGIKCNIGQRSPAAHKP